jgi:hypothetical protein
MALVNFRAAPLPNPPGNYDAQYLRQMIRTLERYFSQLDSLTPNQAQSYKADEFIGGAFSGDAISATTLDADSITARSGSIDAMVSETSAAGYLDADAAHTHGLIADTAMVGSLYATTLYGDGKNITTPYNQLLSTTNQTAAAIDVAYALALDTSEFPDGISIVSSSRITFVSAGIYVLTFSIQMESSSTSSEFVDIWLRKNGTDIPASNSQFGIPPRKGSGVAATIAVTPLVISIAANDYVEIMWRVSATTVSIKYYPAVAYSAGVTPAIPSTPSAIVGVTFAAAKYPPTTYVAPLPVTGRAKVGTVTVVTP